MAAECAGDGAVTRNCLLSLDVFLGLVAHSLGLSPQDCQADARLVEDLDVDSLALQALLMDLEEGGYSLPPASSMVTVETVRDLHRVLVGSGQ